MIEPARRVLRAASLLLPATARLRLRAFAQLRRYRRLYGAGVASRPHGLPGELVVSLTSYPPRFPVLHLTLRGLLDQTVRPDRVVLWIAQGDAPLLPKPVRALVRDGRVDLRLVPDVKSFKKLVFAVPEWPDAFIVTADDDNFYAPRWLEGLVEGYDPAAPAITCHRAHRFPSADGGELPPYTSWEWDVQDDAAHLPSRDLLPTGLGGVLYPPRSLHPDVTRADLFLRLCPRADDLWFFWCARRAGTLYRKVGGAFRPHYWPSSQDDSLFATNAAGNDEQLKRLMAEYGDPVRLP